MEVQIIYIKDYIKMMQSDFRTITAKIEDLILYNFRLRYNDNIPIEPKYFRKIRSKVCDKPMLTTLFKKIYNYQ